MNPSQGADPRHVMTDELPEALTAREAEILSLIGRAYENAQIAKMLYLTNNTIKSHIRSAYRKIGVATRSEAIVWCLRSGLVPIEVLDDTDPRR